MNIACGKKMVNLIVLKILQQAGELIEGEDGLHFHMVLAGIAAFHGIQAATPVQIVYDKVAYPLRVVGHDAHPLLSGKIGGKVVDNDAVNPCAYESEYHHLGRIDGNCRQAHDPTCGGYASADVQMKVLVDNLGHYVQSSAGSIDIEEDSLSYAA